LTNSGPFNYCQCRRGVFSCRLDSLVVHSCFPRSG
jgi:hypothetical protein